MILTLEELNTLIQSIRNLQGDCVQLNEVLSTICNVKLTDESYRNFSKYRDPFFRHILKHSGSCSAGTITIRLVTNDYKNFTGSIDEKTTNLFFYPDRCKGNIFYIKISIGYYKTPDDLNNKKSDAWHANAVIIRGSAIEHIEPNGGHAPWNSTIDTLLKGYFERVYPDKTYIPSIEICPYVGVQNISEKSFCADFSTLLAYLAISCDESTFKIQDNIVKRGRAYVINLINHWSCFMHKYAREHGIIEATNKFENIIHKSDPTLEEKEYFLTFNSDDIDEVIEKSKRI